MEQMIHQYGHLLRTMEAEIGTRDLSAMVLHSLRDVVNAYQGETVEEFIVELERILVILTKMTPRFAIIIDTLYQLLDDIQSAAHKDKSATHPFDAFKTRLQEMIDALAAQEAHHLRKLLSHASAIDVRGKNILIHDHSHSVQDALLSMKQAGQHFQVIVAEQEQEKTLCNIEALTERGIKFLVVPAYMLSNVETKIDLCFMGALTLKNTYDFVTDTGTNAIISQCHMRKIPVYAFLTTSKFALWKSNRKEQVHIHRHTRSHPTRAIEFERLKFSHDRIPLSSVDYVVTELGINTMEEVKQLYDKRLKERLKQERKFSVKNEE